MQFNRLFACAGLLLALAVNVPRAAAQDAPQSLPADIRAGSCAEPGDAVAALNPLVVPEGESQGPNGATPVAQSVTDVTIMVPDMLGATNSLLVYASPDQTGAPIVCGEIGGVIGDDGSLTIGLQAMDGGNASGVASFAPNRKGDGTTVSVNLIDEGSNHARGDNATDGSDDAGGGGHGGRNGSGDGSGDSSNSDSASSDGASGDASNSGAADGSGNVEVPPDSGQEEAINAIAALNPNIAPPPGASHQPGGSGMVDFPGRENRADRRGNGGKGEAASAGADGNASG